jgi:hypothetical protein
MTLYKRPVGILFENIVKVKSVLLEFEKRKIPFVKINVSQHQYNPAEFNTPFGLVINLTGLSSASKTNAQTIFHTSNYLAHLERIGVPVINGVSADSIENSRSRQLSLFAKLNLRFPKTRVINHLSQIAPAALSLKFPVIIKANASKNNVRVRKFYSLRSLEDAISLGHLSLGIDHTALVQEYLYPTDNRIVRIETLDGRFLYALRIHEQLLQKDFNDPYKHSVENFMGVRHTRPDIEPFVPPKEIIRDVERIVEEAKMNVGAVEYLTDTLYEQTWFLGINSLSNFSVVESESQYFSPQKWFVDYVEQRLQRDQQREGIYA